MHLNSNYKELLIKLIEWVYNVLNLIFSFMTKKFNEHEALDEFIKKNPCFQIHDNALVCNVCDIKKEYNIKYGTCDLKRHINSKNI